MLHKKIIFKNQGDLWKFLTGIVVILLIGLSPFIIGYTGMQLSEWFTEAPCHEGNCFWATLPWISFISIPVAIILLIIFLFIAISDLINIYQNKN